MGKKKTATISPAAPPEEERFEEELRKAPHEDRGVVPRKRLSRLTREVPPVPPLVRDHQLGSYEWFLREGIRRAFQEMFPIPHDPKADVRLEYVSHRLEEPPGNLSWRECKERGLTYAYNLYVTFRLRLPNGELREEELLLGEIPRMTERATFIINGNERVMVSQIIRSAGLYFHRDERTKHKERIVARLVPNRGTWLEMGFEGKGLLYARLGKTRRVPLTTLLLAVGFQPLERETVDPETGEPKKELVFWHPPLRFEVAYRAEELENWQCPFTIWDPETGEVLFEAQCERGTILDPETGEVWTDVVLTELEPAPRHQRISRDLAERIERLYARYRRAKIVFYHEVPTLSTLTKVRFTDERQQEQYPLRRTWEADRHRAAGEALKALYTAARPAETSPTVEVAREHLKNRIFNHKNYDLGRVGRFQVSNRLAVYTVPPKHPTLTEIDIALIFYKLCEMQSLGGGIVDDVDHLSNRRVRLVGELSLDAFRTGLQKGERPIRERLTRSEITSNLMPRNLINAQQLMMPLRSFFTTGRLTQYLDQTNPLAELTHKRRLSALGPGGLTRDRAGFDVRDVQYSHYGKICPIETPEGQNIGLITSLAVYAQVSEFGFLRTPYYRVEKGKVQPEIHYLTADEEDRAYIADATTPVSEDGTIVPTHVTVRNRGTLLFIPREEVQYLDASPAQILGLSASLIPFLEHDDANRALMGANMMRQAVPLLEPEPPIVGTGMERVAAEHSGYLLRAKEEGIVERVTGDEIVVRTRRGMDRYRLVRFQRSNQGTIIDQRPIVRKGERVRKGQILADAQAIRKGELALGRNLLVAFMPLEGYNFEDAVVVSERLVREHVFTSMHIEDFECETRRTQHGLEQITRDIPHVPEEMLANLDDRGIVRVGTVVKSGDILVGKLTPKPAADKSPEEQLLIKILGPKHPDFRHTSRKVPHGIQGWVIDVRHFTRHSNGQRKPLPQGVEELVRVYVGILRKLEVGDKLAGRHGNKGVVAKIMPVEDMPYLEDGTPVDLVFSPLCVPSRMNLGQLLELHLAFAGKRLGEYYETPTFASPTEDEIWELAERAGLPRTGKITLFDGRTGVPLKNPIAVGYMYIMKLNHLAAEKIHARSTGSYALVTQQPLGGKAQFGGQRFGEMEVWALEAFGASETLNEMLTIKSDDVEGRWRAYRAITQGKDVPPPVMPESLNVLVREMQGLCLDIRFYRRKEVSVREPLEVS